MMPRSDGVVEIGPRGTRGLEASTTSSRDGVDDSPVIHDASPVDGPRPFVTVDVSIQDEVDSMPIVQFGQGPNPEISPPALPLPGVSVIVLIG